MVEAQTKVMPGTESESNGFPKNFINRIFIDTKPTFDDEGDVDLNDLTTGSWAWLASGINNITPGSNETVSTDSYYDGGGFTSTEVTGKQINLPISGFRKVGDPAQDFIADKYFKLDRTLKTRVIWICNQIPVISEATLTNIVPLGGAPNAKQTFSCTVAFNNQPRIPNGQLIMTATSTKKVYSASIDTSVQPSEDGEQIKAKVIEEASASTGGNADEHKSTTPSASQGDSTKPATPGSGSATTPDKK